LSASAHDGTQKEEEESRTVERSPCFVLREDDGLFSPVQPSKGPYPAPFLCSGWNAGFSARPNQTSFPHQLRRGKHSPFSFLKEINHPCPDAPFLPSKKVVFSPRGAGSLQFSFSRKNVIPLFFFPLLRAECNPALKRGEQRFSPSLGFFGKESPFPLPFLSCVFPRENKRRSSSFPPFLFG